MMKKKLNMIPYVIAIAIIVLIAYSYVYFKQTTTEEESITVCDADQCFWAAHIHGNLDIDVCGENIDLGLEKGELDKTHTHKERGRLHFHERLPVDPETMEITDFGPLRLGNSLENMGIRFTDECIADKCNGDPCDGEPGGITMTVNGEPNTELNEYVWKEGDTIKIEFR